MSIYFHNNPQYNLDTLEITLSNKIQKCSSKDDGELNGRSPLVCIYREGRHLAKSFKKMLQGEG